MILAEIDDGPYNVVYLLHIISVIVGTGAAFVTPILAVKTRKAGGSDTAINEAAGVIMGPALLVSGLFGGALVGLSDDFYDFGQGWLAIGGLIWIIAVAAALVAYPPPYVNVSLGDKQPMVSGILHLSLAAMLVLMTWKFGA